MLTSESFAGQRKGLQYFGSLLLGSKPSTLAFTNVTWLDMKHSEPKMKNRGEAKSEIGLDDASLCWFPVIFGKMEDIVAQKKRLLTK